MTKSQGKDKKARMHHLVFDLIIPFLDFVGTEAARDAKTEVFTSNVFTEDLRIYLSYYGKDQYRVKPQKRKKVARHQDLAEHLLGRLMTCLNEGVVKTRNIRKSGLF
jgi:hypothetical protein